MRTGYPALLTGLFRARGRVSSLDAQDCSALEAGYPALTLRTVPLSHRMFSLNAQDCSARLDC